MDIYHYHPITGEFIISGKADPDPLVQDNWLIPAHATSATPPETSEGQAAVFENGQWVTVTDLRGTTYWLSHEESGEITELGQELPEGATLTRPDAPEPTPEETRRQLSGEIQDRLDAFAQTRDYDDIKSACGYATSKDANFAAEGQYCVDARTDTWKVAYKILDDVQQGLREPPASIADIESELPALAWPN